MSGDLLEAMPLEALPPGPALVAALEGADLDPVEAWLAWDRVVAWAESRKVRAGAAALQGLCDDLERESVAAELSVGAGLGPVAARERLELAAELVSELPETVAALEAGWISLSKARSIAELTRGLDPEDRVAVERAVLPAAGGMSDGLLRRRIRREVLRIDPDATAKRRDAAVADRSVRLSEPDDAGMATLSAYLTHEEGLRTMEAVRTRAASERCSHPDAFVELLTGGLAPVVEIVLHTSDNQPVEVPGVGPIDIPTVRGLVGAAAKVVLRPLVQPAPEPQYRPSTTLRRYVTARDRTCSFPNCNRAAQHCDLDHLIPWDTGGPTSADNLISLCRRHHRLKTFTGWEPRPHPDGSVSWTRGVRTLRRSTASRRPASR